VYKDWEGGEEVNDSPLKPTMKLDRRGHVASLLQTLFQLLCKTIATRLLKTVNYLTLNSEQSVEISHFNTRP